MAAPKSKINLPDPAALAAARESSADVALDTSREVPVWDQDDAPRGSTAESLLVYERGVPVRVAGPTHYHHLVDGRILGGYTGGTHHTEPGENEGDPDRVTQIHQLFEG